MKELCHIDGDALMRFLDTALRNIVLVQARDLDRFGVDSFTLYGRKIYIKLFNTRNPVLDKGATFYVLLHNYAITLEEFYAKLGMIQEIVVFLKNL